MGHILKMAEQGIRCGSGLWKLFGTELPSQHLIASKLLHKREIFLFYLRQCYFSFFCCLQSKRMLTCHIARKSGNRKEHLVSLFFKKQIDPHSHTYSCVTCEHLSLLPLLLLLFSWWTLDGWQDASSCVRAFKPVSLSLPHSSQSILHATEFCLG